jgi:hypothetical protein
VKYVELIMPLLGAAVLSASLIILLHLPAVAAFLIGLVLGMGGAVIGMSWSDL